GEVVSRERLIEYIWGSNSDITSNAVDRHIVTLRSKLADDAHVSRFIETVIGKGYRFTGEARRPRS
ncbi:MAG TPA: helix-turn-helix domain-containing protein, partial [Candidatus Limnocylindrales bacterium]|nr:helix-turn-helix domain-containing protein [Candidatus Limnocylindrales bacterium]